MHRDLARFPPYELLDRDYYAEAQAKYARLERLYHMSRTAAWDGQQVLRDLIKEHGGIHLADDKRQSIARIFSIILWGELAAWNVAADIAETVVDTEAKMAATGQAFDEARHFETMRDYLLELGIVVPPLDPYSHAVLRDILGTDSLEQKLIGMQLLVENVALNLFKLIAHTQVEPVLSGLLPYFARDESRHVGLGIIYLPKLLANVTAAESVRLQAFQVKVNTLILWGTLRLRRDFENIGLDLNEALTIGLHLQEDVMRRFEEERAVTRGIYNPTGMMGRLNELAVEMFFPRKGYRVPLWQRAMLGIMDGVAWGGEKVLARAA